MRAPNTALITRLARRLSNAPTGEELRTQGSILAVAAGSYGYGDEIEELTQPTGFDPEAARLFEALLESAYLVASADGEWGPADESVFVRVVLTACAGRVGERQVRRLVADLREQLAEDGIDKRIEMVGRTVQKPEHAHEVLRVAALLASVSGGVSAVERDVLGRLAKRLGVERSGVDRALSEVSSVLGG